MRDTTVYDLGSVEVPTGPEPPIQRRVADRTAPLRAARPAPRAMGSLEPAGFDLYGTLSLFVPGAGHLLRGDATIGLFFMTTLAFLGTFAWAVVETLERITDTSRLLGFPGGPGVWALCGTYVAAALLQLASVVTSDTHVIGRRLPTLPPLVPAIASGILPGWGQVLNGTYRRACLFLVALWAIGAAWILAIPEVQVYLESIRLYVPSQVMVVTVPVVRYTAPAVVWTLAIYDAASTAASRR